MDVTLVSYEPAFTRLGFGDAWSYAPVAAGAYDLRVVPSESETGAPVLQISGLALAEGHVYTLFLMGMAAPTGGQPALRAVLSADAAPPARLRFLHAAADQARLDARLDGATLFANVPFSSTAAAGATTDYVEILPGEHQVEIAPAGGGPALAVLPLNAAAGRDYTAVALTGGRLAAFVDDNALPTLGLARVRLLHAAADYPAVDLFVNGALALADVPLDTISAYLTVAGGVYDLQIRRSGAADVLATLPTAPLHEGDVYTLAFKGRSPALQAELAADLTTLKTTQAMYIVSPVEPGNWGIKLSGDFGLEDQYLLTVLGRVPVPALTGLTVAQTGPLSADVSWRLTSPVLATQVSIYANAGPITATQVITHTDATTETVTSDLFTGQPLVTGLTGSGTDWVDGSLHTQAVDLSGLPSGSYRIWVEATDGGNAPVRAYAPESVVVARAWPELWAAGLTVTPGYRRLAIAWQPGPNPDVARYLLHLGQPATDTLTFDVGAQTDYALAVLTPGQPYTVTVEAIPAGDTDGTATPARSESVVAIPLGAAFGLTVDPAQISLWPGQAQPVTVTAVTALDPYPDAVGLYAGTLPDDILVGCAADVITPTLAGAQATVVISATEAAGSGTYVVPLVAAGGGVSVTRTITVNVQAPALALMARPAAVFLAAGQTVSVTLDVAAHGVLADDVDLTLFGAPLGLGARFEPARLAPGGQATLILSDTSLLQGGYYELVVAAASAAIAQRLPLVLSVNKPGFDLWSEFVTLVIRPGERAIFPVELTGLDWAQPISLTVVPGQVITDSVLGLSLSPEGPLHAGLELMAPTTAYLRAETGTTTPLGRYTLRVLAKSGGRERMLSLTLGVVALAAAADLYVTQRPVARASAGEAFTQTVTVVNGGSLPASGIVFTDTWPAGVGFVSASYPAGQANCLPGLGRLVCTLADLAAGERVAIAVVMTAPAGAEHGAALVNVAEVWASTVDDDLANNRSERIIPVARTPKLVPHLFLPLVLAGIEPVCTEAIRNGGLEQNAAWTFPITASTAGYSTAQQHSGLRSARFGLLPGAAVVSAVGPQAPERNLAGEYAPLGATYSSGYQTVHIPADARTATLSFWYLAGSEDPANDFQRVMLLRPGSYSLLKVLMRVAEDERVWRQRTFDLRAYRGQDVVVYFEVYNNSTSSTGRSWMYLDDVSLAACR